MNLKRDLNDFPKNCFVGFIAIITANKKNEKKREFLKIKKSYSS